MMKKSLTKFDANTILEKAIEKSTTILKAHPCFVRNEAGEETTYSEAAIPLPSVWPAREAHNRGPTKKLRMEDITNGRHYAWKTLYECGTLQMGEKECKAMQFACRQGSQGSLDPFPSKV